MIRQAFGLLALQATLSFRSWSQGKTFAAFAAFAFFIIGCFMAAAASFGLYTVGAHVFPKLDPIQSLALLDGLAIAFVLATLWGLLIDIQRNDLLDLRRLLHLPVPAALVFFINYLYALIGPATLFFVPGSIALAAGLSLEFGPRAWLLLPVAAAFFFMASTWTYHARGWIAILLQNKRRRRLVAVLIPILVVTLSQAPTLLSLYAGDHTAADWKRLLDDPVWTQRLDRANLALPPLWLARAARDVLDGNLHRAAILSAGLMFLGALGLAAGYRSTLRYYQEGASGQGASSRDSSGRKRVPLTGRRVPLLPSDTGILLSAFFLDYSRSPTVRAQLVMPPLMTLIMCASLMARSTARDLPWTSATMPMFVLILPFLGSTMLLFNLFGADVRGFRGLVLLPMPRHRILLAKNLALFPFVGGLCAVVMTIATVLTHASAQAIALQLLHVPADYLLFCTVGNLLSLYFPTPVSRDALRGQGSRLILMVHGIAYALLASLMLTPSLVILSLSAFTGTGGNNLQTATWGATTVLLLAAFGLYWTTLTHTGDLLTAREQRILSTLLKEQG